MTITQTSRRLALVLAAALLAALLPFGAAYAQDPPAQDGDQDITLDLEGETNVEYAIAWSRQAYPDAALDDDDDTNDPARAFIGRDDLFPDNLASGQLQDEGPLLLTPGDALSQLTADELERLGVENVTVLGGDVAISDDVVTELEDAGYTVDRLEGITRIETAIAIAEENEDNGTVLIARAFPGEADESSAWSDSLAAGAWAAAADADLLLTQTEELTANTAAAVEAGEYENVIIVGGTVAVSQETEDALAEINDNVTRVAGENRAETAVAIANARGFEDSADADVTLVVDGWAANAWADGFSAANLSAIGDYPLVLSNSTDDELPPATQEFLVEDGEEFAAHLTEVDAICGSSVPDADSTVDQCQQVADETGTTVVTVPFNEEEPPPAEVIRSCTDVLPAYNEAPELTGVEVDADDDTIVRYTFDQVIPGQSLRSRQIDPLDPTQGLEFVNFRLYAANGDVEYPTEARIEGDTVITRFASANFIAAASRAGVSYDALTNDQGISNTEGHCALNPTAQAPAGQQGFLALTEVGNYRLNDIIVGGIQDVLVDFTFNGNPGVVTADDFFLVGSNGALYTAQGIATQPQPTNPDNPATSPYVVTVDFGDDAAQVPESQLRRGLFVYGPGDGVAGTPDPIDGSSGILAEEFEGTNGGTVDPDLVEIDRVGQTTFEFTFDEAVSDNEIDASGFYLFDSNGDTYVASQANRVTGFGATVVRAVFETPGNEVADDQSDPSDPTTPVGGYVGDSAVRASDNTQSENQGFNRPDQVELVVATPTDPDEIPAGETALPDLINLIVDQNEVTENYSVTYVFDQVFDTTVAQNIRFSLFDESGFEFAEFGTTCTTTGVECGTDATTGAYSITFSVDEGFTGAGEINNEAIAAAVSGGVETLDEPRTNDPQDPVITEGYFGVNEVDA